MSAFSIVSAEFIKSATAVKSFPAEGRCEFAFFGRSNTGKSSLINMLVNRKHLVKTGSRPGLTQAVNFFTARTSNGKDFLLVDLPGYGYAKVSGAMSQKFDRLLYDYCVSRQGLKKLFFLMDVRRTPTEVEKNSLAFFLNCGLSVQIIATKADKLGKNDQKKKCFAALHVFFPYPARHHPHIINKKNWKRGGSFGHGDYLESALKDKKGESSCLQEVSQHG